MKHILSPLFEAIKNKNFQTVAKLLPSEVYSDLPKSVFIERFAHLFDSVIPFGFCSPTSYEIIDEENLDSVTKVLFYSNELSKVLIDFVEENGHCIDMKLYTFDDIESLDYSILVSIEISPDERVSFNATDDYHLRLSKMKEILSEISESDHPIPLLELLQWGDKHKQTINYDFFKYKEHKAFEDIFTLFYGFQNLQRIIANQPTMALALEEANEMDYRTKISSDSKADRQHLLEWLIKYPNGNEWNTDWDDHDEIDKNIYRSKEIPRVSIQIKGFEPSFHFFPVYHKIKSAFSAPYHYIQSDNSPSIFVDFPELSLLYYFNLPLSCRKLLSQHNPDMISLVTKYYDAKNADNHAVARSYCIPGMTKNEACLHFGLPQNEEGYDELNTFWSEEIRTYQDDLWKTEDPKLKFVFPYGYSQNSDNPIGIPVTVRKDNNYFRVIAWQVVDGKLSDQPETLFTEDDLPICLRD